jgi:DNA-binding response OmpR family regulator
MLKILVVAGDRSLAQAVARSLPGHDLSLAYDVRSALARARDADAGSSAYELILCDHDIADGNELLDSTRALSSPPMFVLVCHDCTRSSADAQAKLATPFDTGELAALVSELVDLQRQRLRRAG